MAVKTSTRHPFENLQRQGDRIRAYADELRGIVDTLQAATDRAIQEIGSIRAALDVHDPQPQ